MGRNGAGKSTLLRHAKGLRRADARRDRRAPARSRCCCRTRATTWSTSTPRTRPGAARSSAPGSAGRERANPRDLSGGERQRLALEIVLAATTPPAVACLDEPTRGMDRAPQGRAGRRGCARSPTDGCAVLVATHDTEFAATFADRVVLMGQGVVIADGPAARDADRRLALRHRGRARARRRRRRAHPEQGAALLERELVSR